MSFNEDIKEEMAEMKKDIKKIQTESFAYEILKEQQYQNRRLFVIWIVTFLAFICLLSYTIYLLNDIEVVTETENTEYTQDIDNEGSINDSYIVNGGYNGEN